MAETIVTVERDVAAPPDMVWALISDVTRMGEWSPEATGATWQGEATGPAVGARFRGHNQQGWRRWSTTGEVVEAEPGRSFAFEIHAGPLTVARWGYRFEPTETGCRVTETWEDHRGTVIKVLGRLATGVPDRADHNREGMETTLANLANAAESP